MNVEKHYGVEYKKECIDVIESGFNDYMQEVIKDVVSVFQMANSNDEYFKDKKKTYDFYLNAEEPVKDEKLQDYYWVDSSSPMDEFAKNEAKKEKIHEAYQKQIETQQFTVPTMPPSHMNLSGGEQPTEVISEKKILDADYNKVFEILSALNKKADTSKDLIKAEAITVDSGNKTLVDDENLETGDNLLGKRDAAAFDGEASEKTGHKEDLNKQVTMKHLVFFMENNRRFKKSNHLFKAYTTSACQAELPKPVA